MSTSRTKNLLVICRIGAGNTWVKKTVPVTINQAIKFIAHVTKGTFHEDYKIVSIAQWDLMQKEANA
jgi:hypothetical protein